MKSKEKTNRSYYKSKQKARGNKDDHKNIYKEMFDKIVKEHFVEIRWLNDEINDDYLAYCFKGDAAKKRFDDFINGIELF